MKIWAHRGCSQCCPENTITAFEKARKLNGLAGIELDAQLTRDEELVVIHDERVDRTTDGIGYVREFTLAELRLLHIHTGEERAEHIPTLGEVLELLATELQAYPTGGLRLNIELKNGVYPYPGMEEKVIDCVHRYGIEAAVVYSSFYTASLAQVRRLEPTAQIGVLDGRVSDCLYKARGLFASHEGNADADIALHPAGNRIDLSPDELSGRTVRAYFGGHLYPEKPVGGRMDLERLADAGVTDVFLNEPERYL